MTATKTSIRDSIVGLRILAQGISENMTGADLSPADLEAVRYEVQEAREALRRALSGLHTAAMSRRLEDA